MGLTSLLLYTMPVMVVLVSVATRREQPSVRMFAALTLAVGGVGLTLLGPGVGAVSGIGVLFGLGSAVVYTIYFFGSFTSDASITAAGPEIPPSLRTRQKCTIISTEATIGIPMQCQM